jgi:hypothetical protein
MRNGDKIINSLLVIGLLATLVTPISVFHMEFAGVDFESAPTEVVDLEEDDLLNCDTDIHGLILLPKPTANLFHEGRPGFNETHSAMLIVLRC